MRDPVAFNKNGVFDITHGICDSIEDIDYSLCTFEFEIRRDLYYWILNELDLYRPLVWNIQD